MSAISFQDGDNFIRNAVTIAGCSRAWRGARLRKVSTGALPVPVEEIAWDLRVDDPEEEEETIERLARAACAFIERRTGYTLLPTVYELQASQWWTGGLEVLRGPFRALDAIEWQSDRDVWDQVDPLAYWTSSSARSFVLRTLSTFDRPNLWQPEDCIRIGFQTGFDSHDETGGELPIEDGLRTILLMVTGHYYRNREMLGAADQKTGVEAVELGATSLLGQYRQFW